MSVRFRLVKEITGLGVVKVALVVVKVAFPTHRAYEGLRVLWGRQLLDGSALEGHLVLCATHLQSHLWLEASRLTFSKDGIQDLSLQSAPASVNPPS